MKTDAQVQKDVMAELNWEPLLNAAQIGVSAKDGVVTLSGIVDTYVKKMVAERATKRVAGVKAVAEEIQVGVSPDYKRSDTEIAGAILVALKWNTAVQDEKIKVRVQDGVVTLEGECDWEYQRTSARASVENLAGVRSVANLIVVVPKVKAEEVEKKITAALQRHACLDANKITVVAHEGNVILEGTVRSFAEKQDAERAAWAAPGVVSVKSNLEVVDLEYAF